jgi:hypothetical protein
MTWDPDAIVRAAAVAVVADPATSPADRAAARCALLAPTTPLEALTIEELTAYELLVAKQLGDESTIRAALDACRTIWAADAARLLPAPPEAATCTRCREFTTADLKELRESIAELGHLDVVVEDEPEIVDGELVEGACPDSGHHVRAPDIVPRLPAGARVL